VNRRDFLVAFAGFAQPEPAASVVLDVKTARPLHESGNIHSRRFHPGSAAKPFTAVAILGDGRDFRLPCTGDLRIGSRRLTCSHPVTTGPVDLTVGIAYSCNAYFCRAAAQLDSQRLTEAFRRFGLDPQVPSIPEQRQLLAIGEWGLTCTIAELALAYRRLAVQRKEDHGEYRALWDGLEAATVYGTARLAQPRGLRVAGKTGTSPDSSRAGTHALFAGWAPAADPAIVVAVFSRGSGGSDAAPLARTLFERYA
jgi:cell division protein FtsI/penicillin-binding protein 2